MMQKIFDLSNNKRMIIECAYNDYKYKLCDSNYYDVSLNIRAFFNRTLYPKKYRIRVTLKDIIKYLAKINKKKYK